MKSSVTLKEQMQFTGELEGFDIPLDSDPAFGGTGNGPKPKGLALTALAGCTAMDVISILRKMKIEPEQFSVTAESELTEEHPKIFKEIHLTYHFGGAGLPVDKLEKAIKLSQERYCGISAMLGKVVPIRWEIKLEG